MAKSKQQLEKEERHKARELERQKVLWEMAMKGSKIARKAVVIKGGKK